jgi:BirA family biotin operon repressor/biotin-[acetyl-CoA-carboxylase] ligase
LQRLVTLLLTQFSETGFSVFTAEFNKHDLYANRRVVLLANKPITGICRGVDKQGGIIIETVDATETYYGGELSLRAGC